MYVLTVILLLILLQAAFVIGGTLPTIRGIGVITMIIWPVVIGVVCKGWPTLYGEPHELIAHIDITGSI